MQFGLSHLFERRAWRIVSGDSGESRPFLLIVRAPRIFTATCSGEYPGIHRSFQHIAKFIYVTTTGLLSIVTAAVYRGFDQELRLAADPIT
jgi:hypothetical protein